MNRAWKHLAGNILYGADPEKVSLEEINLLLEEYPYFAALHFMKAVKLSADGSEHALQARSKAATYFHNPHWFQVLLADQDHVKENNESLADILTTRVSEEYQMDGEEERTVPPAEITMEASESAYDNKRVEVVQDIIAPVEEQQHEVEWMQVIPFGEERAPETAETGFHEETQQEPEISIATEVQQAGTDIPAETQQEEIIPIATHAEPANHWHEEPLPEASVNNIQEETPPREVSDFHEQVAQQEAVNDWQDHSPAEETLIENASPGIESLVEETIEQPVPDTHAETPAEEVLEHNWHIKDQEETQPQEEEPSFEQGMEPAYIEKTSDEEAFEQAVWHSREQEEADNTDLPAQEEPAQPDSPEPLRVIFTEPSQESLLPEIPFEPLHTIDYFASQGIKFNTEEKDQLSIKLKSFTEWLKSMKRLHPEKLEHNLPKEEEAHIRETAETSNATQNIVTEAMAEVYIKQGKKDRAIELLEKLSLLDPSKSAYFAVRIKEIKEN